MTRTWLVSLLGGSHSSRLSEPSAEAVWAQPGSREVPPREVGEDGRARPRARAPFFTDDLHFWVSSEDHVCTRQPDWTSAHNK